MTKTARNRYPTGQVPSEIDDSTIVIRAAGMEFTIGHLRHAGMTDQQIAREVAAYRDQIS